MTCKGDGQGGAHRAVIVWAAAVSVGVGGDVLLLRWFNDFVFPPCFLRSRLLAARTVTRTIPHENFIGLLWSYALRV